jgi:hypothetical protein
MLNANLVGTTILNGLFGEKKDDVNITFKTPVYVGLFTKMPTNVDGSGYAEPDKLEYQRIKILEESRVKGVHMMANVAQEIITKTTTITDTDGQKKQATDECLAATITNQDIMLFPEASSAGGWGKIVGFGLFYKQETGSDTPWLWGEITTDGEEGGVTIDQYEVPIIRVGGFKVTFA